MSGKSILTFHTLYDFLAGDSHKKSIKKLVGLVEGTGIKNDKPKFVYLHLMLPHFPFTFRADGTTRSVFDKETVNEYSHKNYLDQLTFTNAVITELLNKILSSRRRKVIVMEGDHGYRRLQKNYCTKDGNQFKNLNAYYFFDNNYSDLYDSISSVNSFRIICSQYLNSAYPLLKDSAVF